MKQYLLTNALGRASLFLRDKVAIVSTAWLRPETVGTMANDQLATRLATTLCRPGATFLDVGAHIGSVLAEVRHHQPSARLIAIEAIPAKAERLKRFFPTAEVHECAVGASTGTVSFYIDPVQSGCSSLSQQPDGIEKPTIEIQVALRRLDDLVSASDVDVVKIDVEGAELGVLLGATALLDRCRPTVMFESPPEAVNGLGYTRQAIHEFLSARNYGVVVPNRVAHEGPGLTLDGFIDSHLYPRRTTNYFAIPLERRSEIRERARALLGTLEKARATH